MNDQKTAERLGQLSEVLLEHLTSFDQKMNEAIEALDERIEELVEQRINERLKELGCE
ncbi:hypothetical protein [Halomonas sp. S2151]|uniref:hypothetical protein n=1 Tax=Halomonas sp. S2151 TaxID=579478 RepID=UPI000AAD6628|nr:hypothetical protein [Halomonas sp. S2151]